MCARRQKRDRQTTGPGASDICSDSSRPRSTLWDHIAPMVPFYGVRAAPLIVLEQVIASVPEGQGMLKVPPFCALPGTLIAESLSRASWSFVPGDESSLCEECRAALQASPADWKQVGHRLLQEYRSKSHAHEIEGVRDTLRWFQQSLEQTLKGTILAGLDSATPEWSAITCFLEQLEGQALTVRASAAHWAIQGTCIPGLGKPNTFSSIRPRFAECASALASVAASYCSPEAVDRLIACGASDLSVCFDMPLLLQQMIATYDRHLTTTTGLAQVADNTAQLWWRAGGGGDSEIMLAGGRATLQLTEGGGVQEIVRPSSQLTFLSPSLWGGWKRLPISELEDRSEVPPQGVRLAFFRLALLLQAANAPSSTSIEWVWDPSCEQLFVVGMRPTFQSSAGQASYVEGPAALQEPLVECFPIEGIQGPVVPVVSALGPECVHRVSLEELRELVLKETLQTGPHLVLLSEPLPHPWEGISVACREKEWIVVYCPSAFSLPFTKGTALVDPQTRSLWHIPEKLDYTRWIRCGLAHGERAVGTLFDAGWREEQERILLPQKIAQVLMNIEPLVERCVVAHYPDLPVREAIALAMEEARESLLAIQEESEGDLPRESLLRAMDQPFDPWEGLLHTLGVELAILARLGQMEPRSRSYLHCVQQALPLLEGICGVLSIFADREIHQGSDLDAPLLLEGQLQLAQAIRWLGTAWSTLLEEDPSSPLALQGGSDQALCSSPTEFAALEARWQDLAPRIWAQINKMWDLRRFLLSEDLKSEWRTQVLQLALDPEASLEDLEGCVAHCNHMARSRTLAQEVNLFCQSSAQWVARTVAPDLDWLRLAIQYRLGHETTPDIQAAATTFLESWAQRRVPSVHTLEEASRLLQPEQQVMWKERFAPLKPLIAARHPLLAFAARCESVGAQLNSASMVRLASALDTLESQLPDLLLDPAPSLHRWSTHLQSSLIPLTFAALAAGFSYPKSQRACWEPTCRRSLRLLSKIVSEMVQTHTTSAAKVRALRPFLTLWRSNLLDLLAAGSTNWDDSGTLMQYRSVYSLYPWGTLQYEQVDHIAEASLLPLTALGSIDPQQALQGSGEFNPIAWKPSLLPSSLVVSDPICPPSSLLDLAFMLEAIQEDLLDSFQLGSQAVYPSSRLLLSLPGSIGVTLFVFMEQVPLLRCTEVWAGKAQVGATLRFIAPSHHSELSMRFSHEGRRWEVVWDCLAKGVGGMSPLEHVQQSGLRHWNVQLLSVPRPIGTNRILLTAHPGAFDAAASELLESLIDLQMIANERMAA